MRNLFHFVGHDLKDPSGQLMILLLGIIGLSLLAVHFT
jgi:hypothetical protein